MSARCGACRFWNAYTDGRAGECHRAAPQCDNDMAAWPRTHSGDWCGEFRSAAMTFSEVVGMALAAGVLGAIDPSLTGSE